MCYAGKLIKKARIEKKMSQLELGLALGYKNGQFIYHLEIGKAGMPASLVSKLCQILKINHNKLIKAALDDHRSTFEKSIQKWKEKASEDQ